MSMYYGAPLLLYITISILYIVYKLSPLMAMIMMMIIIIMEEFIIIIFIRSLIQILGYMLKIFHLLAFTHSF